MWSAYLLIVASTILVVASTNVIRKDGYCVAYGFSPGSRVPQPYNGPVKNTSAESFTLLRKTCPHLAKKNPVTTLVCCDSDQLNQLGEQFKTSNALFGNCPAAELNIQRLWCEAICSPNQAKFLDYHYQFREQMIYYVSEKMTSDLFNSIRDVRYPGTKRKALELVCGSPAAKSTKQKFLNYIGNPVNGAPILFNFIIGKPAPGFKENSCKMLSYNQSFIDVVTGKLIKPCFHADCPASSRYGPTPPPPKKQAEIIITVKSHKTFPVDSYRVFRGGRIVNFTGLVHQNILREVLHLQVSMMNLHAISQQKQITVRSFCQMSNNSFCKVASVLQYFQMNERNLDKCITDFDENCSDPEKIGFDAEDWHDQIIGCSWNPYKKSNGEFLKLPCISEYDEPVLPRNVFAEYPNNTFTSAKALIIRITLKDEMSHKQKKAKRAWMAALNTLLKRWKIHQAGGLALYVTVKEYNPHSFS